MKQDFVMLVLSRKNRESVVVGAGGSLERLLKVTVLEVWQRMHVNGDFDGHRAGIEAPHARTG
jgi:sRNA-binding carbon storage regulator CsrA